MSDTEGYWSRQVQLFRPIALCSTLYKVIARFVKKRLQVVIPEIIQQNQAGFVQGRLLCVNVLLASELVTDFHKISDTSRGVLKIDLSKAYDNLIWEFLINILEAREFPSAMISWIKQCISTPSYNMVVNGELHGSRVRRGCVKGIRYHHFCLFWQWTSYQRCWTQGQLIKFLNPIPRVMLHLSLI